MQRRKTDSSKSKAKVKTGARKKRIAKAVRQDELLPLPVGTSDWVTFSQDSYCVDKTLILKDIIDSKSRVVLFTRPRRFGKTTAMKMIRAFYEPETTIGNKKVKTKKFFTDKKIWAAGAKYRAEQGKRPVIYLTFKDVDGHCWEDALSKLKAFVASEVGRFRQTLASLDDESERNRLDRVRLETGDSNDLGLSLGLLAKAVDLHYGVQPVILIDEYDQPITKASTNGYYDRMVMLMKAFLSGAMKDNEHCHLGIMTGVLRVAKEGILSGLNNPKVWTVFDSDYAEYFGFTKGEVEDMAHYYGREDKLPEIKAWYDGYDFGGTEIFNPWSVLSYFDHHCRPDAYWLDTSSNDIITEIVRELPFDMKNTLEALLRGETPTVPMAKELGPYKQIQENQDTLYALLVSAGYLKVVSPIEKGMCKVAIPNREIAQVFITDITRKINSHTRIGTCDIVRALLAHDEAALKAAITSFLLESVSYFDTAAEGFFHGLTLGFLAMLRDEFHVMSNAESGEGRFDIALKPLVAPFSAFIIEVKAGKSRRDNLKSLAREARRQIDGKQYDAAFRAEGITDIEKIGLAYYKGKCEICQNSNR